MVLGRSAPGYPQAGYFLRGDAKIVEEQFSNYLRKTISIRDTGAHKEQKEIFYHGILLGLLRHREDWILLSNAESGKGFCDVLVEDEETGTGIVIEVKYRDDGNLEKGCAEALAQIESRGYESRLRNDGIDKIIKYGIACYKKRCKVWAASIRFSFPHSACCPIVRHVLCGTFDHTADIHSLNDADPLLDPNFVECFIDN